jgi:16S rRNA processing protein RimM
MPSESRLIDRDRMVCIGRVSGAHGMHGEIKALPLTDSPEYYEALGRLLLDTARGLRAFDLGAVRTAGGQWVMKLQGIGSRDEAEALKGAELLVDPEQVAPPGENEYFTEDLIGCTVVTLAGVLVGTVTGVLDTGAQPLLEVKRQGAGEFGGAMLVPLTDDIVKEVQLDRRMIRIDPPPGLLELNSP